MLVVNLREEKTKELKQMLYIDNLSVDVESWHVDKKINKHSKFLLTMLPLRKTLIKWIKHDFFSKKGSLTSRIKRYFMYVYGRSWRLRPW